MNQKLAKPGVTSRLPVGPTPQVEKMTGACSSESQPGFALSATKADVKYGGLFFAFAGMCGRANHVIIHLIIIKKY
jgi:hypothetical protein